MSEHAGDLLSVLRRTRSGSAEALGELYRGHAESVYRLAYRLCGSTADAEDVLQDVFLGLPRALQRYDERGRFESWLKRVVVRTTLMRMRSQGRKQEAPLECAPEPEEPRPEPVIERLEVRRALEAMPEGLRAVFVLKEIEGYSHAEIADMLQITPGSSAVRLSRAWTLLRKEVGS